MPAYSLHRASLVRSGRFGVRAAAVAALLLASVTAVVVLTRSTGSPATTPSASPAGAHTAIQPDRLAAHPKTARTAKATVVKAKPPKKMKKKAPVHEVAKLPAPRTTPVAVLNGGTSQGAAAATASRLRAFGYPVPLVGNAGRRDLPSAIEYTPGLGAAARALARKIGPVSYVTPLDGPARNLSGARLLVIIGTG